MIRGFVTSALNFSFAVLLGLAAWSVNPTPERVLLMKEAEARMGRPARAGRSAHVTRQPTRRHIRRHRSVEQRHYVRNRSYAAYYYNLPSNCISQNIGGYLYYNCGGAYYRAYYKGNTVVYVQEAP